MNMELWAATFFAFCRITSFYIFTVFLRSIHSSYGEGYIWTCSFHYCCRSSGCLSHKDNLGRSSLCWYANCNWIITFKNCRNAVEHSKMAGHILDFDIGLSQASLFDVNAGSQSTLLSTILIYFSYYFYFTWRH